MIGAGILAKIKSAWGGITGAASGAAGAVSTVGAVAGAIQETAKAVNKGLEMADKKEERNEGAVAQREKDSGDELQAIRDDRQRAADPAFLDRVRDDHGIQSEP